ncbi:MAG: SurA N-terminal domain-containing protein [Alphaproteobacteria bacterium]|nr:SurA N-terminal domain-containing protein [Alphaproteobacteria bacterium]MBX9976761.1 SurA N-terminal domain-containing protein [Alphaproteobacteria bacterium]
MLEFFRNASKSWIFRGFFLMLAIAFGFLWGIGDVISHFGGPGNQTVLTVGSRKVTARDFEVAVAREAEMIQLQTGKKIDRKQASIMGIDEMVLQHLVNDNLFELEGERLGLVVTDAMVKNRIQSEKMFQDDSGNFVKERFTTIINRMGYEEKGYVEKLRNEMLREEIIKALAIGMHVPDVMALPLYNFQNEKRNLLVAVIKSSPDRVVARPTEEELRTFFNDHKEDFKASEQRSMRALVFDRDRLLKSVPVEDQKLLQEFEARQDEFKGRSFDEVKAELKGAVQQQAVNDYIYKISTEVEDALAGGQALETVAKTYNLDVVIFNKVDQSGMTDTLKDVNKDVTPTLSDLQKAILKQGFLQEMNMPGDLIDVGSGHFFVVEVTDVIPSQYRSFDSVKDKLAPFWTRYQAVVEARALAVSIKSAVQKGELFESVIRKNGLSMSPLKISRSGPSETSKLKISKKLIGQFYEGGLGDVFFGPLEDQEFPDYIVARINKIDRENISTRNEEVEKFSVHLRNGMIEDMLALYLAGAEKRYPVDLNKRYFDSSTKS